MSTLNQKTINKIKYLLGLARLAAKEKQAHDAFNTVSELLRLALKELPINEYAKAVLTRQKNNAALTREILTATAEVVESLTKVSRSSESDIFFSYSKASEIQSHGLKLATLVLGSTSPESERWHNKQSHLLYELSNIAKAKAKSHAKSAQDIATTDRYVHLAQVTTIANLANKLFEQLNQDCAFKHQGWIQVETEILAPDLEDAVDPKHSPKLKPTGKLLSFDALWRFDLLKPDTITVEMLEYWKAEFRAQLQIRMAASTSAVAFVENYYPDLSGRYNTGRGDMPPISLGLPVNGAESSTELVLGKITISKWTMDGEGHRRCEH